MAENPLLPHRNLKELHALMLHCRSLQKKSGHKTTREAILAATSLHLQAGDLLFPEPDDLIGASLAPAAKAPAAKTPAAKTPAKKAKAITPQAPPPASLPRIALAAAAAKGLQAAHAEGLSLAFATAGTVEPSWAAAIDYAQHNMLPFLLLIGDATKPGSRKPAKDQLTWDSVSQLAARLKTPVITVDGEDAVGLYRVLQESTLHARIGGGPAIIWAILTPASAPALPPSRQPLGRLKSYLKVRGIKV